MLGWKILKYGEYKIKLPTLSQDEEQVIKEVESEYGETVREKQIKDNEECKELIKELLFKYGERNSIGIDESQLDYLSEIAFLHIYGYGFLEYLLKDDEIEEISIIGLNKPAYIFKRNKGWLSVNACFTNDEAISDVVNKMSKTIGRNITLQNPRIDAVLPDGSRLHASLPPITEGEITIRKFRLNPFTPKELWTTKTIDLNSLVFLSFLMQSDSSLIVAGNTASGKTTTMNSLFSFVPKDERIILIEETPEIRIPHFHQLRMVSNKEMNINLQDLVYDSLRMRPDRTIVGEVRNPKEAESLFEVLLSGQARGSYATMHAQSLNEALQRIKSFKISELDTKSIDAVLIQRRMLRYSNGRNMEIRKIIEIGDFNGNKAMEYIISKDKFIYKKGNKIEEKIREKLGLGKKEFEKEWEKRRKLISSSKNNFESSFKEIQKKFYGLN